MNEPYFYTVLQICHDINRIPYLEIGEPLRLFPTKESAFDFAEYAANEEVKNLNDGCTEGISFGVPEDEEYLKKNTVKVCYYNHQDDNTEIVTERYIMPIYKNESR